MKFTIAAGLGFVLGIFFFAFESRMLLQDEFNKALYLEKPEFALTCDLYK